MLTCKELAQQHASDYLDHQLTPRQRFGVRVHLMMCSHCRRFVHQLKVVRNVLKRSHPEPIVDTQVEATASRLYTAYHEHNKSLPPL